MSHSWSGTVQDFLRPCLVLRWNQAEHLSTVLPGPLKVGSNLYNLMSNFLHGLGRVGWFGKWCLFTVPLREDLAHNESCSMQIYT